MAGSSQSLSQNLNQNGLEPDWLQAALNKCLSYHDPPYDLKSPAVSRLLLSPFARHQSLNGLEPYLRVKILFALTRDVGSRVQQSEKAD